jgi:bifunctional polynucleotide phosphatase/kinase
LFQKSNALGLVLFCGSPGCGKSTFYWQVLKPLGYERVNQDILKSVISAVSGLHGYWLTFAAGQMYCCGSADHLCWSISRYRYAAQFAPNDQSTVSSRSHLTVKIFTTDNTNADVETRASWIKLARELKIPIRCIHFTAPAALCEHNNAFRALNPDMVCHPQRFS